MSASRAFPRASRIVSPGSRCPRCLKPIKPYDNIPVFGWLLLRGKCRNCALPISPMYPLVEFATGLIFVLTCYEFDISLLTLKWLIFSCLIIVLVVTDFRVRILPDLVNFPGLAMGLALAFRCSHPRFHRRNAFLPPRLSNFHFKPTSSSTYSTPCSARSSAACSSGARPPFTKLVRKRDGMGMGDVKMMAMVGAFLGPRGAFLTILLGTLLGSVIGLALIIALFAVRYKRDVAQRAARRGMGKVSALHWAIVSKYQLPLGTFLAIGALLVVFFAQSPVVLHLVQRPR